MTIFLKNVARVQGFGARPYLSFHNHPCGISDGPACGASRIVYVYATCQVPSRVRIIHEVVAGEDHKVVAGERCMGW